MKKLDITGEITCEFFKKEDDKPIKLNIAELLLELLKRPNKETGASFDSMGKVIKLMRKIETARKEVKGFTLIENAEYDTLKQCITQFSFSMNEPELFDWLDKIMNLPDTEVEEKQEKTATEAVKKRA